MAPNKTFVFKKVPETYPVPGEHITVEDRPIDFDDVPANGLIVEELYASFDPYLRGKMRDPEIKSYSPAFAPNDPIVNGALGKVLKSSNSGFKEGDLVVGMLPIAEYATLADPAKHNLRKVQNTHNLDLALFLGPLGMPGLTGWAGLHKIGKPQKGETIFVSSAAGAVGQVVGQIAKREGLKVIGSVGTDEKLDFITKELGFDSGFNYKKEKPNDALSRLAPDGIDIYFENVGGEHLEAALDHMNTRGRIPTCGMISQYNLPAEKRQGIPNLMCIVGKSITLQGFLVGMPEFGPACFQDHQEKMQQWLADGDIKAKSDITDGIQNAPEGFVGMLHGENFGKAVLKIK